MMGPKKISDQVSIKIAVLPEPKLSVAMMSDLVLKDARDNAGHSMLPSREGMGSGARFHTAQELNYTLGALLDYPKEPGEKIKLLTGDVLVVLAEDFQKFQVDDVLTASRSSYPAKDTDFRFDIAKKSPGFFRVEVQMHRAGLNDDQWAAITGRPSDMSLEDDQGHPLLHGDFKISPVVDRNTNLVPGTYKLTTEFFCGNPAHPKGTKVGDAKKFTWNIPGRFNVVNVPVSFADLPMP